MTLNTYAELWPDRLDEVVEAVSQRRALALDSENYVQIMSTRNVVLSGETWATGTRGDPL
jgi:hypothetical protein